MSDAFLVIPPNILRRAEDVISKKFPEIELRAHHTHAEMDEHFSRIFRQAGVHCGPDRYGLSPGAFSRGPAPSFSRRCLQACRPCGESLRRVAWQRRLLS